MVNGIPIYRVELGEGYVQEDISRGQIFAYAIEATKGPINEPIYIPSNSEAKRIFGVNFAPHFYQRNAAGIYICRVGFPEMAYGSITYQAKIDDEQNSSLVDILKITATSPGTAQHQVNIVKSPTSSKAYNLIVSIEGVGSKKYQNISSLENVVKRINSKFAEYLHAELLFDEKKALNLSNEKSLVKKADGTFEEKNTSALAETDSVYAKGPFSASRLQTPNSVKLSGGSNGKLRTTKGEVSNVEIPAGGIKKVPQSSVGTGDNDANIESTLLYAYREAFALLEDLDLVGVATLSDSEVVQNELVEHINKLIDPEVYKYRFGVTGLLNYPKDSEDTNEVTLETLTSAATHIDNPFMIFIGQGVVFEEDGVRYNLLPHQAVQLYTGLRSSLNYGESIYGGNAKKVLIGVKDKLPLVTDGSEIVKEDIESINEAGLITFKKEYGEITFLEGVTTAQDNPVLSHESVMMIVLNVLKRLIRISKPYQGENVTEDLKSSLINALNNELKNIADTDKTLVALEDYNIPPYAVEVKTTVMAGFNEAGEYIRETHYLVIVKIVPIGTLRSITLSVIVI